MRELGGTRLCTAFVALAMLMAGGFFGTASAGVLDRISQEKAIRIAYREDAPPFSYKDKIGEPVGFMVDLCREVAKKLADQLRLGSLNVVYVPVTAADPASRRSSNKGGSALRADERYFVPARDRRFFDSDLRRRRQPDDPSRWAS